MEQYDTGMEQRVWQRIKGADCPPQKGLQALAAAELTEAAVLLMLSQQLQGKEKALLRKIYEEDQNHAACLKGIHYFTTDSPLSVRPVPPAPDAPVLALRKCYARKLRAQKEYESRASDPEYGSVFRQLAEDEGRHCKMILQIVGNMKK